MNFEYYEIKLRDLDVKPFFTIFLMLFFVLTTGFKFILSRAAVNSFWGTKLFFLTLALIMSASFTTQLERKWGKKHIGMFLSFIPCSIMIIIFLVLEKMLVVSTTDAMWAMGTLGASFFVKPQDIFIPVILIFIFWALQDFKLSLSPRRTLTPRILFWTFCTWWFSKDIFRLGTFLFDLHSFGSWSFTIILTVLSIGSLIGMMASKGKENGIFWAVTASNLVTNAIILVYTNAYT